MILNGVEILKFQSLRIPDAFTFPAFWEQRDEFLELAWNREKRTVVKTFFRDSERELGNVVCECLDRTIAEVKYFIKEGTLFRRGRSSLNEPNKEIIALGDPLRSKYEELQKKCSARSKMTIMGLIALYKLLEMAGVDCDLDVDECLRILESKPNDLGGFYVRCDKDLTLTGMKEPVYPLEVKVLVNTSDNPIKITKGEETICLSTSDCVVGIFHEKDCYKLLPRKGENKCVMLSILYSQEDYRIYLQVLDKKTGKARRMEDVVSFYINKYGYAYVTKEGKVIIPESERFNMYSLQFILRYFQERHIIAITCADDEGLNYDFICSTD
ncbi:hypothetical protein [Parabacteroides sp.]